MFKGFRDLGSIRLLPLVLALSAVSPRALSQAASAVDILILANGDQLTGKLVSEAGGKVTFHSDMAGDLIFTWDKIKSIHTSQKFAVIEQGQHVSLRTPDTDVAQGAVVIQDEKVQVNTGTGAPKEIAQKS